jgi:hypothetical protein
VDEYIVYSTVLVFAVVILVCGGMWVARPARKQKSAAITDLERGAGSGGRTGGVRKAKGTASAVSSSTAGGKLKKKKTKSPMHDNVGGYDDAADGNALETSSFASEASSLLGVDVIAAAAGRGSKVTAGPNVAGASSSSSSAAQTGGNRAFKSSVTLSPQDEALRKTFLSVLKEGMTMLLHTGEKSPKQIQLTLVGTELRWKSAKVFARTQYKVDLREIKFVEWGKQTDTFAKQTSMSASEDMCFSLVTDKVTVDLEASSKVERDALVQGFSLVVGGLRMV